MENKEKQVLELFNKYYEYVRTTDDGEQRGEWKRDFAQKVVKLFTIPDVRLSLPDDELIKNVAELRTDNLEEQIMFIHGVKWIIARINFENKFGFV